MPSDFVSEIKFIEPPQDNTVTNLLLVAFFLVFCLLILVFIKLWNYLKGPALKTYTYKQPPRKKTE